ncbi:ion transporter [Lyngbya sp. PCC 8106]|uniref:ion transporter n=1 Tax=Lyngbya sp. (strain PCC 8106) TaxID=313612 RepID=UPI0000EA8C84|nr:ion transporter [Lyngbya sp. PCC 8106]EAW36297.1 putative potassium channel protein [Lyngbya sp. PCC 8106]
MKQSSYWKPFLQNLKHKLKSKFQSKLHSLQAKLNRFFRKSIVDFSLAILITCSVGLTLIGLSQPNAFPLTGRIETIQQFITAIFALELGLRWIAASSKPRFFRNYWLDIIAILPLLQVFGIPSVVQLLRLLRALRLFSLLIHYTNMLPLNLKRRTPEYFLIFELLFLTVLFGSMIMLGFERGNNSGIESLEEALWYSLYSLFSGEPIVSPIKSLGGRMMTVGLMLMHMTLFVVFTGTVSAFMVDQLRNENTLMELDQLSDHTIICGWNRKAEIIVREYKASGKNKNIPVVVIAFVDNEHTIIDPALRSIVRFLNDDFTKVTVLEKAGVRRANTCIILSDKSHGRSEQDADARTILAALTAEKLNPNVYTCAELINREYASHLALGNVNAYVVSQEHSAFLLAQVALNHGLMEVFGELLSYQGGNHFYRIPLKSEWIGRTFLDLFIHLKQVHNAILIAVDESNGGSSVNPNDYTFKEDDQIILIAQHDIHL